MTANADSTPINKTRLRWSIRDLMIAMAFLCAFLAIMVYMGAANPFFWTCIFFSSVLTIQFWNALPRQKYVGCIVSICLVMFFQFNPLLLYFSVVMALNCFFHGTLIAFSKIADPISPKKTLFVSATMALVSFLIGVVLGIPGYLEYAKAAKKFQPVDISSRLAYEAKFETDKFRDHAINEMPATLSHSEFEFKFAENQTTNFRGQNTTLLAIHDGQVEMFVKSPGFGVGRFLEPTLNHVDQNNIQNLPFNGEGVVLPDVRWRSNDPFSDNANSYNQMHSHSLIDFAHPATLGIVIQPRIVVGNQPHAFQFPIQETSGEFLESRNLEFQSLELISLRRFDTPRVYVLDHLPRMDQLSGEDTPTRELTKFELSALETLQSAAAASQMEIVEQQTTDGLLMVGAVRAFDACLQCHNAKHGELLGAFTYRFQHIE